MNVALRVFAGFIDLLQFIFFITLLAFQLMTPIGGGITGAAAGAYVCYNAADGVISGLIEGAKCAVGGTVIGAGLSAFAVPIGMAIDVTLSCTFGILLIALLWTSGRFSLMPVVIGFATEVVPGVNAFSPSWSILVHRCIKDYKLKQKGVSPVKHTVLSMAGGAAKMLPVVGGVAAAVGTGLAVASGASQIVQARPANRVLLQNKNFDGIRKPANDNLPQRTYAQAA